MHWILFRAIWVKGVAAHTFQIFIWEKKSKVYSFPSTSQLRGIFVLLYVLKFIVNFCGKFEG